MPRNPDPELRALWRNRMAGSSIKRDALLGKQGGEDFARSAVVEAFPRAVIQGRFDRGHQAVAHVLVTPL